MPWDVEGSSAEASAAVEAGLSSCLSLSVSEAMGVRIRQRMLNARDISQPIFPETELLEKLNQAKDDDNVWSDMCVSAWVFRQTTAGRNGVARAFTADLAAQREQHQAFDPDGCDGGLVDAV